MQNKFKKAFTLIELLIVIAIIAILTVAFLPGALKAPAKARDAQRVKAVNDIAGSLESYGMEHNNTFPDNTTNFCLGTTTAGTDVIDAFAGYFANNGFPKDPMPQGSCGDTTKDAYFYRLVSAAGTASEFYVVAAKMEVKASANSTLDLGELGGTLTKSQGLGSVGGDGYYVMYGPR